MHPRLSQSHVTLVTSFSLVILAVGMAPASGDDTGILGRLFRFGGSSSDSSPSSTTSAPSQTGALPYGRPGGNSASPNSSNPFAPAPMVSNFNGLPQTPVTTPPVADGSSARLAPRPRTTQAVTTADPLVTRVALGRSNDGSQFGMFLQVFADGTVIDSEGVHHVRAAELRPIIEAVQSGELSRLRGHCGAPSTDFIEYVHIVVYERRFGRLMANSFSYSGNPQGCDHAIRHIHTALESLQSKLSRTAVAGTMGAAGASSPAATSSNLVPPGSYTYPLNPGPAISSSPGGGSIVTSPSPASGLPSGPVIPLTPVQPRR
jgi:hypothetical protein